MPNPPAQAGLTEQLLRFVESGADEFGLSVTFAALNIVVIGVVIAVLVVPRLSVHKQTKVDVPRSIPPNRPGQELDDVVTEWAKTTDVLLANGAIDPDHVPVEEPSLTEEHS